jgi:DnaJ-class molecular chaperone
MKPKEYRKKYTPWDEARAEEFIRELTLDFLSTWETVYELGKHKISLDRTKTLTSECHQKFKILAEDFPILTDDIWNKIYNSGLKQLRDDWCKDELKRNQEEARRRREWQEQMEGRANRFRESFFQSAFDYATLFALLGLGAKRIDTEALNFLGLSKEATVEDINEAYRAKAKKAHPDQGGSHADFLQLTEMKNRALSCV